MLGKEPARGSCRVSFRFSKYKVRDGHAMNCNLALCLVHVDRLTALSPALPYRARRKWVIGSIPSLQRPWPDYWKYPTCKTQPA